MTLTRNPLGRSITLFVLLFGVFTMTACNPVNDLVDDPAVQSGDDADSVMVKTRFWALFDDAEDVLGGEWDNRDGLMADSCGNGNEGFLYRGGRVRTEPLDDFTMAGQELKKSWEAQGYEVKRASYADDHLIITITTKTGDSIQYERFNGTDTLSGWSGCYPGDWRVIADRESDEIERRESETPAPESTESPTSEPATDIP